MDQPTGSGRRKSPPRDLNCCPPMRRIRMSCSSFHSSTRTRYHEFWGSSNTIASLNAEYRRTTKTRERFLEEAACSNACAW